MYVTLLFYLSIAMFNKLNLLTYLPLFYGHYTGQSVLES